MRTIWATSIWLYLGDVCFVGLLIWGAAYGAITAARRITTSLHMNLTYSQLQKFMTFQIVWLLIGLVGFKFIILQGGPGFSHRVGTGNHGSVQFSTAGEAVAAALTLLGLGRWSLFLYRAAQPTTFKYHDEEMSSR